MELRVEFEICGVKKITEEGGRSTRLYTIQKKRERRVIVGSSLDLAIYQRYCKEMVGLSLTDDLSQCSSGEAKLSFTSGVWDHK